jgi:RNA-binding protein YlmH
MNNDQQKKRFEELAARSVQRGMVLRTNFIDPSERKTAEIAAAKAAAAIFFIGGYDEAERAVAVFAPDIYEAEKASQDDEFARDIISCIRIVWDARFSSITHPDILGASLSIFNDRSVYGDIIVRDEEAYLFVLKNMADTVLAELTSIGRASVKTERFDFTSGILTSAEDTITIRDTVPSLRLDACVAAAYKMSRSDAHDAIASGAVKLNFVQEIRPDAKLEEGDLISIRRLGRAKLSEIAGQNKKGRIVVIFKRTKSKQK